MAKAKGFYCSMLIKSELAIFYLIEIRHSVNYLHS